MIKNLFISKTNQTLSSDVMKSEPQQQLTLSVKQLLDEETKVVHATPKKTKAQKKLIK
jgi:hypothetical protein